MEQISAVTDKLNEYLGGPLGSVLGAILVLIIGWILAKIVAGVFRKLLSKVSANDRLSSLTGKSLDIEKIGSKILFLVLMLMVLSAALNKLNINVVSELFAKIPGHVMNILGILAIGFIGFIIASIVRKFAASELAKTSINSKVKLGEGSKKPVSQIIADVLYGIILLVTAVIVFNRFGLTEIFSPLTGMFNTFFGFVLNILAAVAIFAIGFFVARFVKNLLTDFVSSANLQAVTSKIGISEENEHKLPSAVGSVAFFAIMIPVTVMALDALKIEVITGPAKNMFSKILYMVPNVTGAIAILVITFFVVRFVANIVKSILEGTEVNSLPARFGLQDALGNAKISDIVAKLILFVAMLFAVVAASDILGFKQIGNIVGMFLEFGGQLLLGGVIVAVGVWIANVVAGVVERTQSQFAAKIVRVLIIGLVLAMGLKAMGIADSIVNLAFGLTLGSVAVAFALAFGLGGREAAARCLKDVQDKQDAQKGNSDNKW